MRQGRRVRRVIRRIEPWTVLRASVLFYLSLFMILLVAGTVLWIGAEAVDVIDNVESFIADIGFDDFRFLPLRILRGAALVGLVLVLAGTAANVLMAVLYNLISDVVGGVEVVVLEEVAAPVPAEEAGVVEAPASRSDEPTQAMPMPGPATESAPARTSGIFDSSGEAARPRSLGL